MAIIPVSKGASMRVSVHTRRLAVVAVAVVTLPTGTAAAVTAVTESDFGCRSQGYTFSGGAMLPLHTARTGVADFTAAGTATGSIGYCTTEWSLIFDIPGCNLWGLDLPTVQVRTARRRAGTRPASPV
jgi:hypothetical protein